MVFAVKLHVSWRRDMQLRGLSSSSLNCRQLNKRRASLSMHIMLHQNQPVTRKSYHCTAVLIVTGGADQLIIQSFEATDIHSLLHCDWNYSQNTRISESEEQAC